MSQNDPHLTFLSPRPVAKRSRLAIWLTRIAWGLFVSAIIVLVVGFIAFAEDAADYATNETVHVDGIVVVTGGASRIQQAAVLLKRHNGRRLLISGVNRSVGQKEIVQNNPESADLFPCCIDLDYRALNTRGNAIEAAAWARRHGFHSLMLVTSRWHMPRIRLEMAREAPDLQLVFHPVSDEKFKPDQWWRHADSLRTIAIEYAKFLLAMGQIRVEQAIDTKVSPLHGRML